MKWLCVLGVLAGCHTASPLTNCQRGTAKIVALLDASPLGAATGQERGAIKDVQREAVDRCTKEGLSDAQLACIERATSLTDRDFLTCSALVAKPPSWIQAPFGHPEVLDRPEEEPVDSSGLQEPPDAP